MRFIRSLLTRKGKPIDFSLMEKKIETICKKYHLDLFYLFGGYAKGTTTSLSDLDLAFYARRKVEELDLFVELMNLFGEEAIDLVDLRKAPVALIHRVLKEGKCLYATDVKIKIDFECRMESEYFDTQWMRDEYFEQMIGRIENGTYGIG